MVSRKPDVIEVIEVVEVVEVIKVRSSGFGAPTVLDTRAFQTTSITWITLPT